MLLSAPVAGFIAKTRRIIFSMVFISRFKTKRIASPRQFEPLTILKKNSFNKDSGLYVIIITFSFVEKSVSPFCIGLADFVEDELDVLNHRGLHIAGRR